MSETFECPTCGYKWPKGAHGGHSCSEILLRKLEVVKAERDALNKSLEIERMRLAACGVVAMSDTPESLEKSLNMHDDYKSASCEDVARRVRECIELRARIEAAEKQEPDSWRVTARSFCGTHTIDKEVAEEWLKTGDAYPLYALPPMPVQQDVLDKPAQVGSGIFHAGVKTRLVVEAAQRLYENNSCNGD